MKRQGGLLIAVMAVLVGVFSAGAVQADSGIDLTDYTINLRTNSWYWTGHPSETSLEEIYIDGAALSGSSFVISAINGVSPITLIGAYDGSRSILSDSLKIDKSTRVMTIIRYSDASQTKATEIDTQTIALNAELEFLFSFVSKDGVADTVYQILSKVNNPDYILRDAQTGLDVHLKGAQYEPHVAAVPVPSSALLLGSSIMGLLGVGSRRKKAQAV